MAAQKHPNYESSPIVLIKLAPLQLRHSVCIYYLVWGFSSATTTNTNATTGWRNGMLSIVDSKPYIYSTGNTTNRSRLLPSICIAPSTRRHLVIHAQRACLETVV